MKVFSGVTFALTSLLFGITESYSFLQGVWRGRCNPLTPMKLRDHSGFSYMGIPTWPPEWISIRPNEKEMPQGEVGILKGVFFNETFKPELILRIEWQDKLYMGNVRIDDGWFCVQVYRLFQRHVEGLIKEIGDLELP